jgi:hypothetical protein
MPEHDSSGKDKDKGSDLVVTVHDEDDGSVYNVAGERQETLQVVVDRLYRDHLRRERRPDDRLRCDGNGDDVFAHLGDRLRQYQATQCRELTWNFSGDQGGA